MNRQQYKRIKGEAWDRYKQTLAMAHMEYTFKRRTETQSVWRDYEPVRKAAEKAYQAKRKEAWRIYKEVITRAKKLLNSKS